MLKRLQTQVFRKVLITAYFGYIHSKFSFVVHFCHLPKLFAVQKKVLKLLLVSNFGMIVVEST